MNENRKYFLIGDELTIKTAISELQWGFSERTKGLWNTSKINDEFGLYVISPIKKIIAFGIIKNKFIKNDLIWPDEFIFKKSLWPYRFQIQINMITDNWKKGISIPPNIMLNTGRKTIENNIFLKLKQNAKSWNTK